MALAFVQAASSSEGSHSRVKLLWNGLELRCVCLYLKVVCVRVYAHKLPSYLSLGGCHMLSSHGVSLWEEESRNGYRRVPSY